MNAAVDSVVVNNNNTINVSCVNGGRNDGGDDGAVIDGSFSNRSTLSASCGCQADENGSVGSSKNGKKRNNPLSAFSKIGRSRRRQHHSRKGNDNNKGRTANNKNIIHIFDQALHHHDDDDDNTKNNYSSFLTPSSLGMSSPSSIFLRTATIASDNNSSNNHNSTGTNNHHHSGGAAAAAPAAASSSSSSRSISTPNRSNTTTSNDDGDQFDTTSVLSPKSGAILTTKIRIEDDDDVHTTQSKRALQSNVSRRWSMRSSVVTSEFTVNKLKFHNLTTLYGREQEISILKECYERMTTATTASATTKTTTTTTTTAKQEQHPDSDTGTTAPSRNINNNNKELVLISGESGTGKTSLASSVKQLTATAKQKNRQRRHDKEGEDELSGSSSSPLFISGKFDSNSKDSDPYTGFSQACRQLCGHIMSLRKNEAARVNEAGGEEPSPTAATTYNRICQAITTELGSEISILTTMIPELEELLSEKAGSIIKDPPSSPSQNDLSLETRKLDTFTNVDSFNYAMRRFFRVMCTYFHPLIIMLDDLQWASAASIDLVNVLITDTDNANTMMIIGCYRSDEVPETHSLSQTLLALRELSSSSGTEAASSEMSLTGDKGFNMTELHVGNLDTTHVQKLVVDLLDMNYDDAHHSVKTKALAEICHKKTLGNVFYLIQFIKMLYDQCLLEYNLGMMKWIFDVDEIILKTKASNNVVTFMKQKLQTDLPHDVRHVVQIAACLGYSFEEKKLRMLCDALQVKDGALGPDSSDKTCGKDDSNSTSSDVERIIATEANATESSNVERTFDQQIRFAVDLGLLEGDVEKEGGLRWVHDKLQEGALSLLSETELKALQSQVGETLLSNLTESELESEIFIIVNLLNEGSTSGILCDELATSNSKAETTTATTSGSNIKLAELNLRAARKAMQIFALKSAGKYASSGIACLPADRWSSHYHLTLDLYSTAAEAESSTGRNDLMESHCKEVLAQEHCSVLDKMRVHNVMLDSISSTDMKGAMLYGLEVLKQLGCKFPKYGVSRGMKSLLGLARTKFAVKARTPDDISQLEFMTDPTKIETLKVLDKMCTYTYLSKTMDLYLLVAFRILEWTMKYGMSDSSPYAFAITGIVLTGILSDFEAGSAYGRHALRLVDKIQNKRAATKVMFATYALVLNWTTAVSSTMKPLLKTYEMGLQCGDIDNAIYAIHNYVQVTWQCGKSLEDVEADCRRYCLQMKECNRDFIRVTMLCYWQAIQNLMGRNDDPVMLTGEVMDESTIADTKIDYHLVNFQAVKQRLYAWFGEHEKGAELAISKGDSVDENVPATGVAMMDPLFKGVSLFAMARKTRQRKYKKFATKELKKVTLWVQRGKDLCISYRTLLHRRAC